MNQHPVSLLLLENKMDLTEAQEKMLKQLESEFLKQLKKHVDDQDWRSVPLSQIKVAVQQQIRLMVPTAKRKLKKQGKRVTPNALRQILLQEYLVDHPATGYIYQSGIQGQQFEVDPQYYFDWFSLLFGDRAQQQKQKKQTQQGIVTVVQGVGQDALREDPNFGQFLDPDMNKTRSHEGVKLIVQEWNASEQQIKKFKLPKTIKIPKIYFRDGLGAVNDAIKEMYDFDANIWDFANKQDIKRWDSWWKQLGAQDQDFLVFKTYGGPRNKPKMQVVSNVRQVRFDRLHIPDKIMKLIVRMSDKATIDFTQSMKVLLKKQQMSSKTQTEILGQVQRLFQKEMGDAYRILSSFGKRKPTQKQTVTAFSEAIAKVFQQNFGDLYKQALINTRTKSSTINQIYTNLMGDLGKKAQVNFFLAALIRGYIELFLQHPNTPTNVINSIIEDFKGVLKDKDGIFGSSSYKKRSDVSKGEIFQTIYVPHLQKILVLPRLGRKGVDAIIKLVNPTAEYAFMFECLARNPITTGDQLTKMFNKLVKAVSQQQNPLRKTLASSLSAFSAIASNGKLEKGIRDKLMGVELGVDCTQDDNDKIRIALASNPNLPKKDLQTLSNDPCVSVAVIARHFLKRRFKR